MKFVISRTSVWGNDRPCEEASGAYLYHKKREEPLERWTIEINSLKELLALSQKYERIIIDTSCDNYDAPEIEIYDDYRE